ncbi:MAG: FkbM family methyltransferase [Tunicatimonas sp.]
MIKYLQEKLAKRARKRTFREYGHRVDELQIPDFGEIDYAQWLHPSVKSTAFTDAHVRFYQQLARPGSMIIDIGAHSGDTTVPMALAVGKQGLVLALEPNRYVFKVLEKNAQLNPTLTNIVPLCYAATEAEGEFSFNYSDASFCNGGFLSQIEKQRHGHPYTLTVKGVNLQTLLQEQYAELLPTLDLIKIDAEGYDKEILKTIPDVLKRHRPNLMVECYKRLSNSERSELYDVITQYGYELFRLENFEATGDRVRVSKDNMNDEKHFEMLALHPKRG